MTVFSLPGPILLVLLLPLLFPLFRSRSARKRKSMLLELLPVLLYCVFLLLALVFHGGCGLCHQLPETGLYLSLSFGAVILCYLAALPEEERRSPAPFLLPAMTTLSGVVFLQKDHSNLFAGGGVLAGALCVSSLLHGGAYPGAYLRSFPLRLGLSALVIGALSMFGEPRLSTPGFLLAVLLASVLLLPAPLPRRTEKVLFPGFLRTDQALFVCLPPLLVFHLLRGIPAKAAIPFWPILFLGILTALSGLLFAKTALFVEELADGLTAAGTGFLIAGFLTFLPEGRNGALFLALLLPLATALSGLSLSFLSQRFRTRTFQGLSALGTNVEPLRLAFLLGAFQGMSLPVVGGLLGEWLLLKAISSVSVGVAVLAVIGVFLTFVLVVERARTLFSGESVSRLSTSDMILASEVLPSEGWALSLASLFLLALDLIGSLGLIAGG